MAKPSIPKPKRVCQVEGCDKKHNSKGYCVRHYMQLRLYGKILKRTMHDPNKIIIKGNIAEIVLYNRMCQEVARAIINVKDIGKIKPYKWCLAASGYAQTYIKGKTVGMQHVIMSVRSGGGLRIDHKDRNKLNNRKSNFRLCTHPENIRNAGKSKNNTSGYKGVYRAKTSKMWIASIGRKGKTVYLGSFKGILEAAKAYNAAALKYHGEFACLNEI